MPAAYAYFTAIGVCHRNRPGINERPLSPPGSFDSRASGGVKAGPR